MAIKILLVDDALSMRVRCRKLLEKSGFGVVEADNGAKAILKYKVHKPDIVLMDITMPLMDGIESIKRLLRFDPSARIIVVSAMGTQSYVMEAIMAGAKTFVIKPFDREKILGTIKQVLEEEVTGIKLEMPAIPDDQQSEEKVETPAPKVEVAQSADQRKGRSWDYDEYEWLDDELHRGQQQ